MRDAILSGELVPGQKLAIDAMRNKYDIGATPIREALNRLVSEELVVFRDLRGFYVIDLDEIELGQLLTARTQYFAFLLRESIEHGDDAWEERVIVAFHRLRKTPWSMKEDKLELNPEFQGRLVEFYAALFSGCNSRWLVDFAIRLHRECSRFFWMVMKSKFEANEPEPLHKSIVDAVIARDADVAVQMITSLNDRLAKIVLRWRDKAHHQIPQIKSKGRKKPASAPARHRPPVHKLSRLT